MTEKISVNKADLQQLFDLAVGSLDFGSGWWDDDDTEAARRIAEALGVDPDKATPGNFRHKYPHPWRGEKSVAAVTGEPRWSDCWACMKPYEWEKHVEAVEPLPGRLP